MSIISLLILQWTKATVYPPEPAFYILLSTNEILKNSVTKSQIPKFCNKIPKFCNKIPNSGTKSQILEQISSPKF